MVVVAPGDRFVVRSYSPVTTIGGGSIIDAHPVKHKLKDPEASRQFDELESGDDLRRVEVYLDRAPYPLNEKAIVLSSGLPPGAVSEGLRRLLDAGRAVALGDKAGPVYLSTSRYSQARDAVGAALEDFHSAKPLAGGMAKETLKKKVLSAWESRSADSFMDALAREGVIESDGNIVRLPGATAAVTAEQEGVLADILDRLRDNPVSPPTVGELAAETGQSRQSVAELLALAEEGKRAVRVSPDLYFSPVAMADIEAKLREITGPDGISVSDFKSAIATSRKFALPLLEYFDRMRITARVGDVRKLR
jgi:selenocysteine-specific elongation factor